MEADGKKFTADSQAAFSDEKCEATRTEWCPLVITYVIICLSRFIIRLSYVIIWISHVQDINLLWTYKLSYKFMLKKLKKLKNLAYLTFFNQFFVTFELKTYF